MDADDGKPVRGGFMRKVIITLVAVIALGGSAVAAAAGDTPSSRSRVVAGAADAPDTTTTTMSPAPETVIPADPEAPTLVVTPDPEAPTLTVTPDPEAPNVVVTPEVPQAPSAPFINYCPSNGEVFAWGSCTTPAGVDDSAARLDADPGTDAKVCTIGGNTSVVPGSYDCATANGDGEQVVNPPFIEPPAPELIDPAVDENLTPDDPGFCHAGCPTG